MPERRILSLWFPRLAADRIARRRGDAVPTPLAVVGDRNGAQVLVSLSVGAEAVVVSFSPSFTLVGEGISVALLIGVLAGLAPAWLAAGRTAVGAARATVRSAPSTAPSTAPVSAERPDGTSTATLYMVNASRSSMTLAPRSARHLCGIRSRRP